MFTSEIIKEMKYYVYLLSDPINGDIFYVGKGKGNRVFSHLKDNSENEKTQKIKELKSKGLEPKIEFLVHGVEDEITIKKIEAAIIDLIGKNKLTNKVAGYESSNFGRMDLTQIKAKYTSKKANITEKVVLIKLNKTFRYNMHPNELYDTTRGIWRISKNRQHEISHAFAVYDGIIQETYKIEAWFNPDETFTSIDTSKWEKENRYEFIGNICENMRKKYRYKSAEHYWKSGNRNPIRYSY